MENGKLKTGKMPWMIQRSGTLRRTGRVLGIRQPNHKKLEHRPKTNIEL